jgi:C-terminal processing protease CtpA/Prc
MPKPKFFVVAIATALFFALPIAGQGVMITEQASREDPALNRSRGIRMLKQIKSAIKDNYYDKTFHGLDLDAKFDAAMERVKTLDKNWQIFRIIAGLVLEFNDSHTRFYPPGRANRIEYGFSLQMIGAKCFVTDVTKGSDAEAKGLKPGDQVVGIGRFNPSRENLWKINYLNYALDPQAIISVFTLGQDGKEKELKVEASFKSIKQRDDEAKERRKKKREDPFKCHSVNADIIACRLETFSVDKKHIDRMMTEVVKHRKLVLDLRGNGGGYVRIAEYLTGHFFDRDTKIADFVTRDKTRPSTAKPQKERAFSGDLAVLVDSNSASASEVFSRLVQIEKRGKVFGDVTAGAVMTSQLMTMAEIRGAEGFEKYTVFGMNLTIADLIMSDGKRLEGVGVVPDFPVGPTGSALANRNDPVLAYAVKLFGGSMTDKAAGDLNFIIPKTEDEDDEESDEAGK